MHQVQILTPDADQPGPNTDPRCIVAKGERGHPTRTRTRVYRVLNMRSDRHTKEPGSLAWQPESIFIRSDDHIVTLPSPSGSAHTLTIHLPRRVVALRMSCQSNICLSLLFRAAAVSQTSA